MKNNVVKTEKASFMSLQISDCFQLADVQGKKENLMKVRVILQDRSPALNAVWLTGPHAGAVINVDAGEAILEVRNAAFQGVV